jgi:hypothetical protein
MRNIYAIQTLKASKLIFIALGLTGCSITVQSPTNNATVTSPARAVVTGNASFSNLMVTVDGTDFSNLMTSTGSGRAQGDLPLPTGLHTITATATVPCWYCGGGSTTSSNSRSFVVVSANTKVCARSGGAPVITLATSLATVGQTPGRQQVGYRLQNGDGILILVDDAPGILPTQMLVEVDLDPFKGVTRSKMIEAWDFCQAGSVNSSVTSGIAGGVNVGVACDQLTAANDFRSGCTSPTAAMLINQGTTSELWLRKQGTFGNWDYAEAIDQSMWQVFGGRHLRFIWISD